MQERELKIELMDAHAHTLADDLGEPQTAWLQENIYLDTPHGSLAERRFGLRLRAEWVIEPPAVSNDFVDSFGVEGEPSGLGAPAWTLTLKGPSTTAGALHVRSEDELQIDAEAAARIRAEGLAPHRFDWPALDALGGPQPVVYLPLGAIRTLRRRFACPGPDQTVPEWLDLDATLYPDGTRAFELELELDAGPGASELADMDRRAQDAEARVRAYLSDLGIPWHPSREGKFSRFLKRRT